MATLIAPTKHSPVEDAETIYSACKGFGTDEKAIISILGHRTAQQRQQIIIAYQKLYHEDLVSCLDSELSGDFKKAVHQWIFEPADRDALLANEAIKKAVPDYHVIIEIACVGSPEELFAVRQAYQVRYKRSLEEDVAAHTTGDIRTALSAFRYAGDEINERLAESEAGILDDAIKDKTFNHEENLKGEGNQGDDFAAALRTAMRCIKNSNKYFVKVVHNAMKGAITDEDSLTRVMVTRAEKDLKEIKELYYNRNSVSFDQAVANNTSGDYKDFLLTLSGKED
ncbi:hypothetical protein Patl1_17027 [Pistacia atlantica]|uniref:Uncharacterized protein n=1 Tax=Pistacia atlantica TaxID=434234 RepID=A0ACC1B6G7_9ROSI|nr:hypothetical protein Patl1_17027 [Pistacia atlantica]